MQSYRGAELQRH